MPFELNKFLKKNKIILIIFFISFITNIVNINYSIKKFDRTFNYSDGDNYHGIIRTPPEIYIWKKANEFKNNFSLDNLQSSEYRYHFLPPKILALSSITFNIKFFDENDFDTKNIRFHFIFQTLIYLLSVVYLYNRLNKINVENKVKYLTVTFLFFDPTINQFHPTIFGETIFFALIITLIGFLIKLPKNNINYFILGILISIIYLQRSVAMLLILAPILVIILKFKFNSIKKIICVLIIYLITLLILGSINYKRSNIFYFFPTQTIDNLYVYFIPKIEEQLSNKSSKKIKTELINKKNEYVLDNKLDIFDEKDRITIYKFQRDYAFDVIFSNKVKTIKIALISSLHSMLLNPIEIYFTRLEGRNYYKGDLHQKSIKYRVAYSVVMYLIILIGFVDCLIKKRIFPHIFLIVGLYFFSISSWVGYTRYFIPTYLTLSIYFGFGLSFVITFLKKNFYKIK